MSSFTDPFNFLKNKSSGSWGRASWANRSMSPFGGSSGLSSPGLSINNQPTSSSWKTMLAYVFGIFVLIMIILVIVHFTLKPIFQLVPGGSGIIPTPGFNDAQVFWKNLTDVTTINESKDHTVINNIPFNFTLSIDMFINNPYQFSTSERGILTRSSSGSSSGSSSASASGSSSGSSSLSLALLPDTNDLVVSVRNVSNIMENIIVKNVPVNSPFRITTVVLQTSMEVYINGTLYKTRVFNEPPKGDYGYIIPATMTPVAQLANLILWNRPLSPFLKNKYKRFIQTNKKQKRSLWW